MKLLGIDVGSSSVKASIIESENGVCLGSAHSPQTEMIINSTQQGWAEQSPTLWWENVISAIKLASQKANIDAESIDAIGISYQMHGLVCIDQSGNLLRPSIIWCDSRAVEIGQLAFESIGKEKCLTHLLNSPGNFTASKLKWIKDNQPEIYKKIYKIMLPGDYIAFKLTDKISTSASGLSEGILWDFSSSSTADFLLDYYGFKRELLAALVPTFGIQGYVSETAAEIVGLKKGIPVAYRAGDQPNNALSLNVLEPGEIAATAGTSGVVYGVSDVAQYDPLSRVNTFLHVNTDNKKIRNGVLLCINGTGILNSWLRKNLGMSLSYDEMNDLAMAVDPGANHLKIYPFGNGAERMLNNLNFGCQIVNLNFNLHSQGHLIRAAHEGLAFSFYYGMQIMKEIGITSKVIRAGNANMFLSPVFRSTLSSLANVNIELYNTDGSVGAAIGAGIGTGIFSNTTEAFKNLKIIQTIKPDSGLTRIYEEEYKKWLAFLEKRIK